MKGFPLPRWAPTPTRCPAAPLPSAPHSSQTPHKALQQNFLNLSLRTQRNGLTFSRAQQPSASEVSAAPCLAPCLPLPSSSVFCFLFFLDFEFFLFFRSTSSLMRWATEKSKHHYMSNRGDQLLPDLHSFSAVERGSALILWHDKIPKPSSAHRQETKAANPAPGQGRSAQGPVPQPAPNAPSEGARTSPRFSERPHS